jgi:hypothetical protein
MRGSAAASLLTKEGPGAANGWRLLQIPHQQTLQAGSVSLLLYLSPAANVTETFTATIPSPVAIPNDATALTSDIAVSTSPTGISVNSVTVCVGIVHALQTDVKLVFSKVGGSSVTIKNNGAGGVAALNGQCERIWVVGACRLLSQAHFCLLCDFCWQVAVALFCFNSDLCCQTVAKTDDVLHSCGICQSHSRLFCR